MSYAEQIESNIVANIAQILEKNEVALSSQAMHKLTTIAVDIVMKKYFDKVKSSLSLEVMLVISILADKYNDLILNGVESLSSMELLTFRS